MRTILSLILVLALCAAVFADNTYVDRDQAIQLAQAFRTTFLKPPFDQYILGVEVTTLADESAKNNIELSHGEQWDWFCLDVTLGADLSELPEEVKSRLPPTFWNIRVFYNPAPQSSVNSQSDSEDVMMCTMLAYICPDGSVASRTPDCLFVCGSSPIGGLTYDEVSVVRDDFLTAFADASLTVSIDTLYGKKVKLTENEKLTDYCLDVTLMRSDSPAHYPGVYNGVRVFYYNYLCSSKVCSDGSIVDCDQMCPEETPSNAGSIVVPFAAIIFVVAISTCCCYMRRRCRAKCAANATAKYTPLPKIEEPMYYPAEQYELQQQQELSPEQIMMMPPMMPPMVPMHMMPMPMSPQMAAQMGYPPMMPPPMMMPSGQYPIMMQAPNGMWFPAPQHPEDA